MGKHEGATSRASALYLRFPVKKIFALFLAMSLALPTTLHAGEGMWIPLLMKKLNYKDMKKAGLKLSAKDLYDVNHGSLKDAIVSFGGFCTGEIISSEGLILTNHHCGYDAIQKHSTLEHNYLADGFWAMTRAEELSNPGLFVNFLVRIEDVTKDMTKVLKEGMSEAERSAAVAERAKELIGKATDGTDYDADVESFYHENEFYLFVYEKFSDVRLVGAPQVALANTEAIRTTGCGRAIRATSLCSASMLVRMVKQQNTAQTMCLTSPNTTSL